MTGFDPGGLDRIARALPTAGPAVVPPPRRPRLRRAAPDAAAADGAFVVELAPAADASPSGWHAIDHFPRK